MTLRTSEIAALTGMTPSSIRDYSDLGLLGPVARMEGSGYRYFDLRQAPQAYIIKILRGMGLPLQQLADIYGSRSPGHVRYVLDGLAAQLKDEIAQKQANLAALCGHCMVLEEGAAVKPGGIEVRELPAMQVRLCTPAYCRGKEKREAEQRRLYGQLRQNGHPGCPVGYVYREFFDYLEAPELPAQLYSVDPFGPDTRPAGRYLVGAVNCGYGEGGGLGQKMYDFALQQGVELAGSAFSVYIPSAAGHCLLQVCAAVG